MVSTIRQTINLASATSRWSFALITFSQFVDLGETVRSSHSLVRGKRKGERELKIAESARNADAQLKLQVTSEDERREMHFNRAGNKFIMSFVRYLCRATLVSHRRGWITAVLVNVGVTRVQHAGRARVTPLCLLPANYIEHNAIRRPDLYFSCTRKIHLVVRHTGLSLRHNRIVPLSRGYGLGFIVRGSPLEIPGFRIETKSNYPSRVPSF